MAFNKDPANWFDNWSSDGTNITVPIATFPELSTGEAAAVTGDIREVLFAWLDKFRSKWYAAAQADRPTKLSHAYTATVDQLTGEQVLTYTFTVRTTATARKVSDEPG